MKLVVVDANAYWTEQLFRRCGRFADVLLLKPRDFRAHRRVADRWRSEPVPRQLDAGVWEQRLSMPPGWMVELWPWAQRRLTRVIRRFADDGHCTLVLTFPQYRGLLSAVPNRRSVYYNLDDYRDNWPRHSARIEAWEMETVAAADLTICIADYRVRLLQHKQPDRASRIHHLPLGVTPEFMAASASSLPSRHDPPVAGYIGALNYRFDFAFLAEVAARLPELKFVLGGRVDENGNDAWRTGLARARTQRNIHFAGWLDHARLPEHLAGFDVLLMPYAHCNFNTNACPAKLWDYLGTGKPIVANDANPETLLWSQAVRIGATPERFAAAIQEALAERDPAARESRLRIARAHTWDALGERLEGILASSLS